jgi:hypothetical protein
MSQPTRESLAHQAAAGVDAAPITSRVVRLTPEQLEWYRQRINEEEVVATLRDLRANGGMGSEELLSVLDDEAGAGPAPPVP